jgi:calmodulin
MESDGFITFEDFVCLLYYHAWAANPKRALFNAFRLVDKGGIGKLHLETVRKILEPCEHPLSPIEIDELLSLFEIDSDDMMDYTDRVEKLLDFSSF